MATEAKMGYVGFVQFEPVTTGLGIPPGSSVAVRVTDADVKTQQAIDYPDVVDGQIDRTVYKLGPKETGGGVNFPLVHEGSGLGASVSADCTSAADNLARTLWRIAAERDSQGRLAHLFNTHIRYADNLGFTYPGCLMDQMTWTINAEQEVTVSAQVIGGAKTATDVGVARKKIDPALDPTAANKLKMLAPARVVTWNDARIKIYGEDGAELIDPSELRNFSCEINNQIERFYTLNGRLAPQDIAAKKRELSGSMTIMGHNEALRIQAESNEDRFTSKSAIAFGYSLGASSSPYWATGLYGVVFEIEQVSLGTGLFETTTNWSAMGDCDESLLATSLGTGGDLPDTRPADGHAQFGGNPAADYPEFT